ncbi:hypothetical protein KDL29_11060 [bacterium]|nr:hypothetical protein [bacterium]
MHDGFARHANEFEIDSFLSDYVMPDQAIAYLQSPELAAADNNLYFAWINPGTKAAPVDNRFCVLRFIIGALIVIPAICWLFYGLYIVLRELVLLIWSWFA